MSEFFDWLDAQKGYIQQAYQSAIEEIADARDSCCQCVRQAYDQGAIDRALYDRVGNSIHDAYVEGARRLTAAVREGIDNSAAEKAAQDRFNRTMAEAVVRGRHERELREVWGDPPLSASEQTKRWCGFISAYRDAELKRAEAVRKAGLRLTEDRLWPSKIETLRRINGALKVVLAVYLARIPAEEAAVVKRLIPPD